MNAFEEHQLFTPIINDSRFALQLRDHCNNDQIASFKNEARCAIKIIARENELSLRGVDIHEVNEVLWAYYENQLKEERAAKEAATIRIAGSTSAASNFEQHTNRMKRHPKESPIMATPTFNTITYVSGKPIDDLSSDELIQAIKACEKEIDSLREVKRESTKVTAKIAALNDTADKIRDALDARA